MKRIKLILRRLRFFPVAAPLVFVLFFFGFMPPCFDLILYTQNIVGEGTCSSYLSSPDETFAYLYKANAYFGSELQTLRLRKIRYNVSKVRLEIYDVESADIIAVDVSVFGRIVTHQTAEGSTHPFRRDVREAASLTGEPVLHLTLDDPEEGLRVALDSAGFIPVWLWSCLFAVIILVSLALALGISYLAERYPAVRLPLLSAAAILAALTLGAWFCGSFPYVNYTDFLLNWLLLFAGALILNALTLPWIGTVAASAFTLFWYLANYFVISFRGKPIMPADLKAVGTAMEVVNGYRFQFTWPMVLSILAVAAYCAAVVAVYRKLKKRGEKRTLKRELIRRGITVVIGAAMIVLAVNNTAFRSLNSFQWNEKIKEAFHREGIVLTYINGIMSSHVRKPDAYSREAVDAYFSEYQARTSVTPTGTQPVNIIMVMNEAFSDLRTVGLDERVDVMPFIDSLQENTLKGDLYVSVLGGGTCNTEFEALTGNSLAFFGTGAYPYTENVTEAMFSLASYFRELGYETEAFHANRAQNWNRNQVYPYLGFGAFHSLTDYPESINDTYLHSHPADIADYLFMESVSEAHAGQKRFLFNVTMQNHSGYERFEDVEEDGTVKEYGGDLAQDARVYLSLIRASDEAVQQLVETYQNSDEPTMIIFFGDHQPGLSANAQKGVYMRVGLRLDYYKTKFFIWTNYETEAADNVSISANYLPWLILERGNFPLPPYIQMLKEVHEKYPIISSQGVIDAEGNVYDGVSELLEDPLIRKYRYVQYANVFDELDPAWFRTN